MQTKHLRYPKGLTRGFQVAPSAFHWPKKLQAEKDRALSHCHAVMETGCAAVLINSRKAVAVGSNQQNNQQKTMSRALERLVSQRVLFFTEALIQPPPTRLSTVGSRALSVYGPSTWDDLHLPLRQKPFLDSFRSHFKGLHFQQKICLPCFRSELLSSSASSPCLLSL